MAAHLIYEISSGNAVSIASTDAGVASPLPGHLADRILTQQEFDDLSGGWTAWDPATFTLVPTGKRTREQEAQREANLELILAAMTQALTELGPVINSVDVDVVPAGTLNTNQLSVAVRTLRDNVQLNRVGIRRVAVELRRVIKYLRDDLDTAE